MKCWIIYNGFLQSDKFRDYANMLAEAATSYHHEVRIFKNNDLLPVLTNGGDPFFQIEDEKPDYILFTDKDIYLAKQLEMTGVPVFNSAKAIEVSDDKIKTYQALNKHKLPIPKTIILPKTFGLKAIYEENDVRKMIEQVGLPLIMKEAFGSFGEQVYLINDLNQLQEYLSKHSGKPLMLQQFIQTSYGKDLRLQVVGDKVVAAMIRSTEDDFRANITSGGKMAPYEPAEREMQAAVKASQAIDANFSGVDLLFGPNNEPIICEVNSNAHIRNLYDCTGINAAYDIIQYIEQILHKRKQGE